MKPIKKIKRNPVDVKTLIYTKTYENVSQKLTLNIDNKTLLDDRIITNHFNNFFTSIAGKLLKKIPKAKKTFDFFLKKSNTKIFFLSPIIPEELLDILKTFHLNEANGPSSIPMAILKDLKNEISITLSTLINLSYWNIFRLSNISQKNANIQER